MPAQYNVLVIEDEVNLAFTLKHTLEELSNGQIEVIASYKGRDAVTTLFERKFDLVISDLRLPDVSGLALLARVKKMNPQMKTILMTAFGSEEVRTQAELFTDAFLTKPFDPMELMALVGEMLGLQGLDLDEAWKGEISTGAAEVESATAVAEIRLDASPEAEILCPQLYTLLQNLNMNVSASHSALLDLNGHTLLDYGKPSNANQETLNILLANSMASSGEVARQFPKTVPFLLHYYGNEQQEVYCCAVNHQCYLILAIDLQVTVTRVGSVWMYLKRTVSDIRYQTEELAQLNQLSSQLTSENFNIDVESALTDALFGEDLF